VRCLSVLYWYCSLSVSSLRAEQWVTKTEAAIALWAVEKRRRTLHKRDLVVARLTFLRETGHSVASDQQYRHLR
jgi:hypothetical protein